ncbi:uncharacterized protein K460DRAFT_390910 [Cucurbitaria berberidis CBS 394.84]|uniref:BTB domain-containing protein n=1 Tax=Cucurbitaria berberidis CBS 394.84 TaxID=1168544 RepID=A0A9P4GS18_9PLEO|nr:uncharacterized protein K460DRAFT_390910 [Cucurbitaria berberidis CBS 394.84]KAF1850396.1 hypothetical protein K460DRAFT_390910 [Cucurbitaria berberidis CBS 394.84]
MSSSDILDTSHAMARKRTHDEVSLIASSIRADDTVLVTCPDTEFGGWHVSGSLLQSVVHNKKYTTLLEEGTAKELYIPNCSPLEVELFLQWLYFGSYSEESGFAKKLSWNLGELQNTGLEITSASSTNVMVWAVKAAWLSWYLGAHLEAPQFQNYAMTRLFDAYERQDPKATVDFDLWTISNRSLPKVALFFEEMVIRNWGDTSVVDHTREEWSLLIVKHESFRVKFMKGMAVSLEKRREEPMKLEHYLIEED